MAKVEYAIKDMFATDLPEFEAKISAIQTLKVKALEAPQGAFQENTFEKLDNIQFSSTNMMGTLSFLQKPCSHDTREMKQLLNDSFESIGFGGVWGGGSLRWFREGCARIRKNKRILILCLILVKIMRFTQDSVKRTLALRFPILSGIRAGVSLSPIFAIGFCISSAHLLNSPG